MRFGITFRISLTVFVTVVLLGGALGAFFVAEQDRALRASLDRRVRLLGAQVATYLSHELVENAPGEVEKIVGTVIDPEVAYVFVMSPEGEVRAGRWTAETRGAVTEYQFPIYSSSDSAPVAAPEAFGVIAAAPGVRPIATLAIGVDLTDLSARRRRLIGRTVGAAVGAGLAATLLGVLFVRLVLRRSIDPLLAGLRGLAGGDLSRRVKLAERHDEIDAIGQAFNEMADRLESTLVSKGDLEGTVERRTSELKEALLARQRAQEAVAEREAEIRLLLDSTAEAIYGIGPDGLCTFCNPASVRALGYSRPEELVGRDMHGLVHHSTADGARVSEKDCAIYRTLRDQRGYHSDNETLWRSDGTSFPVELWSYPMIRDGRVAGSVVTFLDLTERRRLEGEVLKMRKLESLGVLAGGIAHDFNNLLMGILGNLTLAREELSHPADAAELLGEAEQATLRARQLTQQLLTFSRGGAPVKKVLSIRSIVEESTRFALSGAAVRGEQGFAPDLWPVEADPGQLGQVIHNLVINAVQAMPHGGIIRIVCENVELPDGAVAPLAAGRYVRISVRDQGPGIPADHLPRLFDPYFTTKKSGHGLGLASVYSIARRHGGHVTVSSTLGEGSTFDVYLPASPGALPASAGVAPSPRAVPRRGRVLVMDDEDSVRRVAASMLGRLGYEVETAPDGAAAIAAVRAARADGRPFALLLMDLTVPGGMGGAEAVTAIRAFDPGVPCVATSGYSNDPIMAHFRDYGFTGAVAKPYSLDDLAQALASAAPAPSAG